MFRKKDDELQVPEPEVKQEETAYEDNWYRSLKALAERATEPEETEDPAADAPDDEDDTPDEGKGDTVAWG